MSFSSRSLLSSSLPYASSVLTAFRPLFCPANFSASSLVNLVGSTFVGGNSNARWPRSTTYIKGFTFRTRTCNHMVITTTNISCWGVCSTTSDDFIDILYFFCAGILYFFCAGVTSSDAALIALSLEPRYSWVPDSTFPSPS